ncbi:alpha/beta hydrolase family protein [Paraburkholderia aspalathi]|uniref:alpha/beta hydrolase family protein n=1 Tax=Paraburkholderia aspalathi TaxID=1324617 RepID=UPI0038B73561
MANLKGDINNQNDGLLATAFFAAQGFVTIAPDFAGYGDSSLPYSAFLNADQHATDMMDALRAVRKAFPHAVTKGARLFVTGYSQGGYVAMSTQREMEKHPDEFQLAGVATGSGPYAISLLIDKAFNGAPGTLAPMFLNLIATSWQNAYGDVYGDAHGQPADMYESQYASDAQGLLPSHIPQQELFKRNRLPERAAFETGSMPPADVSDPDTATVTQAGFSAKNFYVRTAFRNRITADIGANPCQSASDDLIPSCQPTTGLRKDALRNDLRNFTPKAPLLMCGAHSDTIVYFASTQATQKYFATQAPSAKVTVVDVAPGLATPANPWQAAFNAALHELEKKAGPGPAGKLFVASQIHIIAAPVCIARARAFFSDGK